MTFSRILVLTTEPVPVVGSATTGAGLRAWGLAQGLRSRGHDVIIASPAPPGTSPDEAESGTPHPPFPDAPEVRYFARPHGLSALLADVAPQVVVLQHWGMAAELPELTVPLAIDLAGPHLLERLYWGDPDPDASLLEKLAALRRADFLTCSGEWQRHYFLPFLAQAGWDVRTGDLLPVIPFSVAPLPSPLPEPAPLPPEPTFVYGGAFLAWQDPSRPVAWLLEELDRSSSGRLLFYGGSHPVVDASGGRFAELAATLKQHPRVEMRPFRAYDQLLEEYRREGTVALDLMARNPERELAYTTRTVVYLSCGLPVLYNNYSELSASITAHQCGWTLDPEDEAAFRTAVRTVLDGTAPLAEMRTRALAAAASHDWNQTITPLAEYCSSPTLRPGKTATQLSYEAQARELRNARSERDAAVSALLTLQGKLLYRLQRKLPALAAPLAPLLYLATLPLALYVYLRLARTNPSPPPPR